MSLTHGWTGGQYSLFRVLLGGYLLQHFVYLLPWGTEMFSSRGVLPDAGASPLIYLFPNVLAVADSPAVVTVLLSSAAALALLFAVGYQDRWAALGIWYVWACLLGRNPLISNPSLPYVGWMLLAHACLPPAPYGSLSARKRADPNGAWTLPPAIFAVGWTLMALGYSYSGYTKLVSPSWVDGTALSRVLENPLARPTFLREWALAAPPLLLRLATWGALALELGFTPLALVRRLRPIIWTAMLLLHAGLFAMLDFADLTAGMVFLHLWTFDPAWVPPRRSNTPETLFYDGHCALCHGCVRFVLAEDRSSDAWRFAPLDSEAATAAISEEDRRSLPDSLAVRTSAGQLLTRSRAVLHILASLGGYWRVVAAISLAVPRALADVVYDAVAFVRYRVFGRSVEACPLISPDLRSRFLF
jgi:predicted DCC family thiol-disulfide oxidoreductase YuxK